MSRESALYSTVDVLSYLGAIANDTKLLDNKHNRLNPIKDLPNNRLHRIIYATIENLYMQKDVNEVDVISLKAYLTSYPDQLSYYNLNKGDEVVTKIKELAKNTSFSLSLSTIKKLSLLREYEKIGINTKDIFDTTLIEPKEIANQRQRFDLMNELDIRNIVKSKLDTIHEDLAIDSGEQFSFQAGEDLLDLITKCKEEPTWGYSFQSKLFNAVFRGMLGKKLMIRSASTGGGKSRQMVGDMCCISALKMFNTDTNTWVDNPKPASSVFITTELDKEEIQLCLLATVSGVAEDIIKNGKFTKEVEDRLMVALEVIKNSKMQIEFASDFSLTDLESIIEKNIHKHNTAFVFFDYIQITPKFSQELNKLFGENLREDQKLNLMVTSLKNMANKYNLFILTATQLNRNYKVDEYPDATHLRGGQSTADKCDYGVITMRVSNKDKEKLEAILSSNNSFNCPMPTHGHHIFKNRGGKYTGIIIWVSMNLDNMRVTDCFVTTQDLDQVYVEPVVLQ